MKTILAYDESGLTIINPPKWLEKKLQYKEKLMLDPSQLYDQFPDVWEERSDGGKKRVIGLTSVKRVNSLIEVLQEANPRIITTMAGFVDRVSQWLRDRKQPTYVKDSRLEFPSPDLKAIRGTRFSQASLLRSALVQEQSGLIGAPTRYGKTKLLIETIRCFPGIEVVVTAPGDDLFKQLHKDISEAFPNRKVVLLGGGSRKRYPSTGITVASVDSLHLCDAARTGLLLIDEPHSVVSPNRIDKILAFSKARKYGYGATLEGRFDGRDILIEGAIGPILVERTFQQGVAEGAICQIYVLALDFFIEPLKFMSREQAYNRQVYRNTKLHNTIAEIMHMLPSDWQSMAFIQNEKQVDALLEAVGPEGTIAMAKKLTDAERTDVTKRMVDGSIKRCLASNIYGQGVTFSDIRVIINASGGGGSISCVQKPGRLAEIRPSIGKKAGIMIDFNFKVRDSNKPWFKEPPSGPWKAPIIDTYNRFRVYKKKGYPILEFSKIGDLVAKAVELA